MWCAAAPSTAGRDGAAVYDLGTTGQLPAGGSVARIELWNGDICDLEVDAIVAPANPSLWMATGVGAAIKKAAGDVVEFAAVRQAPVALGDAIVTDAGQLAARVVIHAVSVDRDRRTSAAVIEAATRAAMARARELELSSIAFPALGTGVGGFSLEESALVTVRTVREELAASPSIDEVIFALRGSAAYHAFAAVLGGATPAQSASRPGDS
jgi:O-acetyl-ADP-ribose deacetylase (regulator of RNase III)